MIDLTLPGPTWLYTLQADSRVGGRGVFYWQKCLTLLQWQEQQL